MSPKVLLHGVPETTAIWDQLRAELDVETHALALPGFGTPRPAGFGATMDDYAEWLVAQLEGFGEPVDLVGHDWGGILSARVASWAPSSLRSWVSDAAATLKSSYHWHDLALIWQTPGAGEEFWAGMVADRAASAGLMATFGVPDADAAVMIDGVDETMIACILDLYRSADGIGTAWEAVGPIGVPGLVLVGSDDQFGNPESSQAHAEQLGARFEVLPGAGHFWPAQAPSAGAAALSRFWAELDET